mmetsp:Transcript_19019/g.56346  ORF Transcript_19019/g.56346 Transcript_19019/m.56346 type:complete len:220 (+) Transcript_19019:1638-2297(+)
MQMWRGQSRAFPLVAARITALRPARGFSTYFMAGTTETAAITAFPLPVGSMALQTALPPPPLPTSPRRRAASTRSAGPGSSRDCCSGGSPPSGRLTTARSPAASTSRSTGRPHQRRTDHRRSPPLSQQHTRHAPLSWLRWRRRRRFSRAAASTPQQLPSVPRLPPPVCMRIPPAPTRSVLTLQSLCHSDAPSASRYDSLHPRSRFHRSQSLPIVFRRIG